jgi:hypothetical protein
MAHRFDRPLLAATVCYVKTTPATQRRLERARRCASSPAVHRSERERSSEDVTTTETGFITTSIGSMEHLSGLSSTDFEF